MTDALQVRIETRLNSLDPRARAIPTSYVVQLFDVGLKFDERYQNCTVTGWVHFEETPEQPPWERRVLAAWDWTARASHAAWDWSKRTVRNTWLAVRTPKW